MKIPTISQRSFNVLAILVFGVFLCFIAFGTYSYNDFFWHLALGKWMFAKHSFLTHDIFSYTFEGKLWLNNTWLFDGSIYLIYTFWSYIGLNVFRLAIFALTFYFLVRASMIKKNVPLLLALSLFLFTIPHIRNFIRPEIAQSLFIAYFLYALYGFKYYRSKLIYTLPIIEIIWVNTHGSFSLGLVLVGIFFGSELLRGLIRYRNNEMLLFRNKLIIYYSVILVLCAAASLLNPYGITIYTLLQGILADKESLMSVSEWIPMPLYELFSIPLSSWFALQTMFWLCVGTLIVKAWKLALVKKNLASFLIHFFYEDVALLGLAAILMLGHKRYTTLCVFIAALVLIKNSDALISLLKRPFLTRLIFAGSIASLVYMTTGAYKLNYGPSVFDLPRESADFVLTHDLKGNMLNEYAGGSELTWLLYPKYKVFIDGRTPNLYDNDFYWYYRHLDNEKLFKKVIEKYQIGFAVVPNNTPLATMLTNDKQWQLIFFDNSSSVFVLKDGENKDLVEKYKYTALNPNWNNTTYLSSCTNPKVRDAVISEIRRNMSELNQPVYSMKTLAAILMGCAEKKPAELQQAIDILQHTLIYKAYDYSDYYNLGMAQMGLNRYREALENFKKSTSIYQERTNMTGLGMAYYNLEKYEEAEKIFLQIPYLPGNEPAEYYQTFGWTSYQLDRNARAINLLNRYIDMTDADKIKPQDYIDISNAYKDNNQSDKALEYILKAQKLQKEKSTSTEKMKK